jgi:hypothetical protein
MNWRTRKLREVMAQYEGVLVESLPARQHFWLAVLRPVRYLRWRDNRFKKWAAKPGDTFEDFQMDETYKVLEAPPGRPLRVAVYRHFGFHGEALAHRQGPLDRWLEPDERSMDRWQPLGHDPRPVP